MIKKLKQDKGNLSVLLEVKNLTDDERIGLSRILNGVKHTEASCGQYLMEAASKMMQIRDDQKFNVFNPDSLTIVDTFTKDQYNITL